MEKSCRIVAFQSEGSKILVDKAELVERTYGHIERLVSEKSGLKNVQVLILEIRPGECTSRHFHPNEEVFYLLSGYALFCGEKEFLVKEGDIIAVPPNVPHQIRNDRAETPCRFLLILSPPYDQALVKYC